MRRSQRADADTPRDTPGNVEATRAAANAASSEEDSSNLSALDKETPPSSIPQQTKVESGEPKATSGPGGGNISVSAIFYISWHPQFPTQIPWLVRRNNQLPTTTTDHTERREASEGWEGGVVGRGFELEIGDIS